MPMQNGQQLPLDLLEMFVTHAHAPLLRVQFEFPFESPEVCDEFLSKIILLATLLNQIGDFFFCLLSIFEASAKIRNFTKLTLSPCVFSLSQI